LGVDVSSSYLRRVAIGYEIFATGGRADSHGLGLFL
jgi:hypothetical protein